MIPDLEVRLVVVDRRSALRQPAPDVGATRGRPVWLCNIRIHGFRDNIADGRDCVAVGACLRGILFRMTGITGNCATGWGDCE
jgi:hypothetical protein